MREDDSLRIARIFEIEDEPMPQMGNEMASNEATDVQFTVDPDQCFQPAKETQFCDAETNTDELNYLFESLAIKTEQFTQEYFINDDAKVKFYTGLPSYDILQTTFDFVKPDADGKSSALQTFQQFILVLMKLRLNVPHQDLAYRFGISVPTVSRIFNKWMNILDRKLSPIISWPDREDLWRTMPKCFRYSFAELAIPAFTRGKDQLDPIDVEKTRGIANVRIHVERVIGLLRRKYTILQSTLPIDYLICSNGSQSPLIDKIIRVAASLTNLCPSIVPFE
eukprot:gene2557-2953_t